MSDSNTTPKVTVIGGGMITRTQLLPTMYHLQREGLIGDIGICALNAAPLAEMTEDRALKEAFVGQNFTPHPDPAKVDPHERFPDLYKEVLGAAPRGSIAVIAVPEVAAIPAAAPAVSETAAIAGSFLE